MVTGINQKNMFSVLDEQQETQKTQAVEQKTQEVEQKTQAVEQKTQAVEQKTQTRSTFKGREATLLVRKAIQKTPNNVESRSVKEQTHNNLQSTKFVVATRYLERGNASNTRPQRPDYNPANYTCTKACTRALLQENGKYGVCTRVSCTFAHSLDELRTTICRFDASCKTINGTYRSDWTTDTSKVCQYQHSNETKTAWSRRTGQPIPALPQTKICQPEVVPQRPTEVPQRPTEVPQRPTNVPQRPVEERQTEVEERPTEVHQRHVEERHTEVEERPTEVPQRPVEERQTEVEERPTEVPQRPVEERQTEDIAHQKPKEFYNHVFPSPSQSYTQNFEYSSRRNRSLSPVRHNYEHVITVPTKELAEVVVKSMFDREIYNFRIILG
jgi:hypothetical protein